MARAYGILRSDRDRMTNPTRPGRRYISAELRAENPGNIGERDDDIVVDVTLWSGIDDSRPRLEVKVVQLPPGRRHLNILVNGSGDDTRAGVEIGLLAFNRDTFPEAAQRFTDAVRRNQR